ncbi:hypothetical protein IQ16_07762 [Bradyrhizobium huanghuaihaiense]|uniref:Uncharacterized protein n=1 Tax=Bradyrhizobium huanghuaihaiense TaxID=990078 RepID=A0A562QVC6_9BRAD|nr:hypothetical protein [Bradyrhizobium huanghuaihaiense]TWI60264.1 hypothetical protein IQ16_07762 [Bradyrhizobium huanghuaihaiense]
MQVLPGFAISGSVGDAHRRRWLFVAPQMPVVLALLLLAKPASAKLCELSSVSLPEKSIQLNVADVKWPVVASGRLDFSAEQDLYGVTETVAGKINNASSLISQIISKEVSDLPNDNCGSIAIIHNSQVAASSGNLQIATPVTAQQWGCLIGVAALIAEGRLTYTITISPVVQDGKLGLRSLPLQQRGDLQTTVPDFDSELTNTVQKQLKAASTQMSDTVQSAVAKLQSKLKDGLAEVKDPTEPLQPLYAPKLSNAVFRQQADSIVLIQTRRGLVREGTACKIHEIALQKWTEF